MSPLVIEILADVTCPWCYLGKCNLDTAIALKPKIPVELRCQPYLLDPWVPREGMSRTDFLIAKFGSVEAYNANTQQISDTLRAAGLHYRPDQITRQPNTLDCHRLIRWAEDPAAMMQRLMLFFFSQGRDLSDPAVLVRAAIGCGFSPDDIRKRLASDKDVEWIQYLTKSESSLVPAESVPQFRIGVTWFECGLQPPEYLAEQIEQVAQAKWSEEQLDERQYDRDRTYGRGTKRRK
jgi:predicted DsbA family dithiol-disulfide isomerase